MHTVPHVTRQGYHYELSTEPREPSAPGVDYCWDLDTGHWVKDTYAMMLAKTYMRQHRDDLLHNALAVLDRHEKQERYGLPTTLSTAAAREVAVYVQALRDVPQQPNFPDTIHWPSVPAALNRTIHEDHLKIAV